MNEYCNRVNTIINYIILGTISFIIGYLVSYHTYKPMTPPVGESVKVDSIIKVNDSLKLEVKPLDNDSTAKLFYKLIGK